MDGKIFRSVWSLLVKPGRLTAEYWDGRVVSWIRPLRLFLIAAALHLLVAHSSIGPMNFRLVVSENASGERHISYGQNVSAIALKPGYRPLPEAASERLLSGFRKSYSSIRYSAVIGFALLGWLVYRTKQSFLVNHLVLALHYYAFLYVLSSISSWNIELTKVSILLGILYLLLLLRRVYKENWWRTVVKTALLWTGAVVIEFTLAAVAYRMVA